MTNREPESPLSTIASSAQLKCIPGMPTSARGSDASISLTS